jgi:pilus assembly protein Flp/PilA
MGSLGLFLGDESGTTAIEYGLIAALIGVVIIGGVRLIGTSMRTMFSTIYSTVNGASTN